MKSNTCIMIIRCLLEKVTLHLLFLEKPIQLISTSVLLIKEDTFLNQLEHIQIKQYLAIVLEVISQFQNFHPKSIRNQ